MEPRPYGCSGKAVLVTLGIVVFVLVCGGVSMLAVDGVCWNSLSQKLPIYPNATITLQRHNFLREFGMGTTVIILDSDDPVEKVRDWYGRTVAAAGHAAGNDPLYYIPVGRYSITHAEDGTGTQIILSGDCIS
jgi:hypothetical protein